MAALLFRGAATRRGWFRVTAAIAAAVVLGSIAATPAAADITASIQGSVLVVEDDPGASTSIVVAEYFHPVLGQPYYSADGVDIATGRVIGARAGPGCTQHGAGVRCPVTPVTSILLNAGDGAEGGAAQPSGAARFRSPSTADPVTTKSERAATGSRSPCAGATAMTRSTQRSLRAACG